MSNGQTSFETFTLENVGIYRPTDASPNAWLNTGITLPAEPKKILLVHVGKLGKLSAQTRNTKWQGYNYADLHVVSLDTLRDAPAVASLALTDWSTVPDDATSLFWVDITTYALARNDQNQMLIWWSYPSEGTPNTGGPNPLSVFTTSTTTISTIAGNPLAYATLEAIRLLAGDLAATPILSDTQTTYIANRNLDADNTTVRLEDAAREYAQIAASFQIDIAPERSEGFRRRAAELASSKVRYMQSND